MPLARDVNAQVVQVLRPSTNQELAVGAASVTSALLTKNVVRLCASVDCRVAIGQAPTALVSSMRLPAGVVEYIAIYGSRDKIAVIRESIDGALTITEMD